MLCTWCNGTGRRECVDPYNGTFYMVDCEHCDEDGQEANNDGC